MNKGEEPDRDLAGRTLREVRAHELELETRNRELGRAREHFAELYEQAPVGYCIVGEDGLILEANLAAAALAGETREALLRQPVTAFIHRQDHALYERYRAQLLESSSARCCELRMVRADGSTLRVHMQAARGTETGGATVCRLVIMEASDQRPAGAARTAAREGLWAEDVAGEAARLGQFPAGLADYPGY